MGTVGLRLVEMKHFLLISAFLLGVSCEKPTLGVYYESLCPYSINFITDEVFPAYTTLSDYFDVFFVPYGNARTTGNLEDGFTIKYQHGERECQKRSARLYSEVRHGHGQPGLPVEL